jgi:hypothetical protein
VSQTPCDIPLPCEDGENSSSATAPTPASDAISASLGDSSLQDHQSRLESFGTRALGQSEVFEASLFELRLVREPLNAIQVRSWDPMVEEATICAGRHSCQNEMSVCSEQSVKESLEVNVGSGCSTPPPAAMSPRVVDHNPSIEVVKTPVLFRSEAEQLLGFELIKVLSNFKHSLVAPSLLSTQQNTSLEKKAFEGHMEGNQSCSRQQKVKIES